MQKAGTPQPAERASDFRRPGAWPLPSGMQAATGGGDGETVRMRTTVAPKGAGLPRANTVLAMLLVVYVFNFIDRQILAILAAPIQADLGLSDGEMGVLGGLAFALLYSTLAVPLAVVADRASRSWVIAGSLVVWSVCTALCGLAQGFGSIFLARLGVGVGEAGGVAPAYALIGDYFPSSRRAGALSIYSLGIPLGSAAGVLAGGYIAARVDWRMAFVVVGLGGLLVAPLFKLLVRDRPQPEPLSSPSSGDSFGLVSPPSRGGSHASRLVLAALVRRGERLDGGLRDRRSGCRACSSRSFGLRPGR